MTNDEECAKIATMNPRELFDLVMSEPWLLTDHYYHQLGTAIRKRYDVLKDGGAIL